MGDVIRWMMGRYCSQLICPIEELGAVGLVNLRDFVNERCKDLRSQTSA